MTQINWRVKHVYCKLYGLTRLWHVSYRVAFGLTPINDPNPLRPNPNPQKPVLGSCRVRGLGWTLTSLTDMNALTERNLQVLPFLGQVTSQALGWIDSLIFHVNMHYYFLEVIFINNKWSGSLEDNISFFFFFFFWESRKIILVRV